MAEMTTITQKGGTGMPMEEERYDNFLKDQTKEQLIIFLHNTELQLENLRERMQKITGCREFGNPDGINGTCVDCSYNEKELFDKCCNFKFSKNKKIVEPPKEQEAVPVIQREIMHMLVWCCGSCGVAITDGDKFCRMCGKGVKWE